jgi:hypothetical protein
LKHCRSLGVLGGISILRLITKNTSIKSTNLAACLRQTANNTDGFLCVIFPNMVRYSISLWIYSMPSSEQTNIRIFVDSTKLQSICQQKWKSCVLIILTAMQFWMGILDSRKNIHLTFSKMKSNSGKREGLILKSGISLEIAK